MEQSTAKQHLDWCVERAMVYANDGDWPNAWASFMSDVDKHPGTEHIRYHELAAMAMMSGSFNQPKVFEDFISGWAVKS